jgi:signal peptidase
LFRVAEIYNNFEGERIIRAKGDVNPSSIPGVDYPIRAQQYISKLVYVIPQLGYITRAISPPINYIVFGLFLVVIVLLMRRQRTITVS